MRHARPADLDPLEPLLEELRELPGLRERARGSFSRGSQAFLHFHVDDDGLYADVRLTDDFERMRVTTRREQATFLSRVRRALRSPAGAP